MTKEELEEVALTLRQGFSRDVLIALDEVINRQSQEFINRFFDRLEREIYRLVLLYALILTIQWLGSLLHSNS